MCSSHLHCFADPIWSTYLWNYIGSTSSLFSMHLRWKDKQTSYAIRRYYWSEQTRLSLLQFMRFCSSAEVWKKRNWVRETAVHTMITKFSRENFVIVVFLASSSLPQVKRTKLSGLMKRCRESFFSLDVVFLFLRNRASYRALQGLLA